MIAGNGMFPVIFAKKAAEQGYFVATAAFRGEGDESLATLSHAFRWVYLGQVRKIIRFFKDSGVDTAVMMGGIRKTRMFVDVRPDTLAIKAMARMRHSHDDGVLRLFADILQENGIRILHSTALLPELLSPPGLWTRIRPPKGLLADIEVGWEVARRIGELDVGQCVVVGGGSVLAVEAIDGTDATIRRGGGLGRGDAVLVKLAKPGQDMRFDIPAVGPDTIRVMAESGLRVMVLEAGKTLALDREALVREAERLGICVIAMEEPSDLTRLLEERGTS
ncbi:LpxI family protein [Desulfobotulus sp.]|uniref:LpxI family protein n=1 Tax=Desulfobotulus sp. TaxID=1940337 RepID=UPI002A35F5D1|nr:UDP-2,3-diacylglucosamine diphosphatase LpxI [Desulfobotulus sp.]MDY0162935.1 UDP-2,3-diacylglucosamine diphosphatase LpxI [Desulfobotulus sp.]